MLTKSILKKVGNQIIYTKSNKFILFRFTWLGVSPQIMHCLSSTRKWKNTQVDVIKKSRAHAREFKGDDNVSWVLVTITCNNISNCQIVFHPLSNLARFDFLGFFLLGVLLSFSFLTSFSNFLISSGPKSFIRLSLSLTSSLWLFWQYLTRSTTC